MAKIRETGIKDPYTGENQKELITDDGKEYIIRATATKSPYTGKHEMEIVERKHYDGPAAYAWSALSLFGILMCLSFEKIIGIVICAILMVGFFLKGVYDEANTLHASFSGLLTAYLCAGLFILGLIALPFVFLKLFG